MFSPQLIYFFLQPIIDCTKVTNFLLGNSDQFVGVARRTCALFFSFSLLGPFSLYRLSGINGNWSVNEAQSRNLTKLCEESISNFVRRKLGNFAR